MTVGFEIQPLLDPEKTGIGYYADGFVSRLIGSYPESRFLLEGFAFRDFDGARERIKPYEAENSEVKMRRFPRFVYRAVSMFLPIPYKWFFSEDADVRHFFNFIIPPLVKGKKVVTIHDMVMHRFPETVRAKTKYMLHIGLAKTIKQADLILADSEFTKQEILHFYKCCPEKITVLYPGIDKKKYHENISPQDIYKAKSDCGVEGEYILYLGTLEPRKNIERLVEAYSILKEKHPQAPDLVIAGRKGWMFDSIFQEVKRLGVESNVHFTGYVPDGSKPGLMAGAMFFCFPSLYEGFGLPPLEAMSCGTPVMVSNAGPLPEVTGGAGLLADPYSVGAISDAMEKLFLDDELRLELRDKGLKQAARFDWDIFSEELFGFYKNLVDSKSVVPLTENNSIDTTKLL